MKSTARISTDGTVIEHLMATGDLLPSQLPLASSWSAEKRLAAAVLSAALIALRDRRHDPSRRTEIEEDLAWVSSDDVRSPYAFLRLCDVFALEATWVREIVRRWGSAAGYRGRRAFSMHRHAA